VLGDDAVEVIVDDTLHTGPQQVQGSFRSLGVTDHAGARTLSGIQA
jgi:hypothetical protein